MALRPTSETLVSSGLYAYAQTGRDIGDGAIRIASGFRVVRGGDDPGAIALSTKLLAETAELRGGLSGSARTGSLLQVARTGLDQIQAILTDLLAQANAASGTGITPRQYSYYDAQFQSRLLEIDAAVASTQFDGKSLLDGSLSGAGALTLQVGNGEKSSITLDIPNVSRSSLFSEAPNLATQANSSTATTTVTNAKQNLEVALAKVEAYLARLTIAEEATERTIGGLEQGIDGLLTTDLGEELRLQANRQFRENAAAFYMAQTLRLNSNLLQLVQG